MKVIIGYALNGTAIWGDPPQYSEVAVGGSSFRPSAGAQISDRDYIIQAIRQTQDALAAQNGVLFPNKRYIRGLMSTLKKLNAKLKAYDRRNGLGGLGDLGATKKLVLKPPTPAQQLDAQENTNTRNMLIGVGAVAILGSLAFYIFNKKG